MNRRRSSFLRGLLIASSYSLLAIAMTWPLVLRLTPTSPVAGDSLDAVQTVWGFRHWRYALQSGSNPMFTSSLWWPTGTPLWLQTWDIPSATFAIVLAPFAGDTGAYNAIVLLTFPLSGLAMYLLCRELWTSQLAAWLAGALYAFSTYHLGHAMGQLHIASMQWSPLFFLALSRFMRTGSSRQALLAAAALALATLASPYHLLFCLVGCTVIMVTARPDISQLITSRGMRATAAGALLYFALAGWLPLAMVHAMLSEPYVGSHDSVRFSADLWSFFLPNRVNALDAVVGQAGTWTGNEFELSTYIGLVTLVLAIVAAKFDARAKPFLTIAIVGAVLSLGPFLHVGGRVTSLVLPAYVLSALPLTSLSGLPVRFSWLATFGCVVAAGATLSVLCGRGRRGTVLAVCLAALGIVEAWPKQFHFTTWARPAVMETWAEQPGTWAVLDSSEPGRALWHQMLHKHPIVGGYITRTPAGLWYAFDDDHELRNLFRPPRGTLGRDLPARSAEVVRRRLGSASIKYVVLDDQAAAGNAIGLNFVETIDGVSLWEVPTAVGETATD